MGSREKKMLKIVRNRIIRNLSASRTVSHETTHFGNQTVSVEEKQGKVNEVFTNVADTYDKMNDAMSMGVHRAWKDWFVDELRPRQNTHQLDMAGGTGDIAFRSLIKADNLYGTTKSNTRI